VDTLMQAARASGRARGLSCAPRLLRRRPLLAQQGLPRTEHEGIPQFGPQVRQPVSVGAHLLGLERGQPHLQPTFTRPRLAVRYYRMLRRESRRRNFRVLAADVLDTANMHRYLRTFLRHA
jgi:hypothetical protein